MAIRKISWELNEGSSNFCRSNYLHLIPAKISQKADFMLKTLDLA
jgi:hypothetical protein